MPRKNSEKIRNYVGKIMVDKHGDDVRNDIASAFIETARALEKLEKPITVIKQWCMVAALAGGIVGAAVVAAIIILI